jgi:hypothetical protein
MTETIRIEIPRRGLGSDLSETLVAHGLNVEIVDEDDLCALRVRFAEDEHERLVERSMLAIEAYLSDRMLPLVAQRAAGGAVVRPHGN